jgi:AcrR family transcriptional regulator
MARTSTRDAIMAAAVSVAARHGISGSSMDEIAEEASVAKGSLYYHFASKDAIFEHVLQAGFDRLADAIRGARVGVTGLTALRAVTEATLAVLQQNPARAKIVASEMFRTDRPWVDAIAPARSSIVVLYRDVLREVATEYGHASDADAITETAGAAFFGAIAGAGLEWLLFHPEQPLEAVVDQVLLLTAR